MNRTVFALIGLFVLRDCDVLGPRPGTVVTGTWGGDNAGLMADDTSGHVHIACTFGDVHQAIVIGQAGRFDVPGSYVLRAYPIYVGPSLPARFHGSVSGRVMMLSITVTDTTADTTAQLGPVRLIRGVEPKMGPCPICRRPRR
ncbi:MAG TPA: hypothetical protein VEM13_05485 [Gemmatimonadales bacterium]|nr:hypothetical protein [Gemmatimonadales bacterium]